MDLRDYLRMIRARWAIITLSSMLAVALAAILTWAVTPQFASSAQIFISTSAADDAQAFQGSQFSLQRVKSYADLVTGREIARRVVDDLQLEETPKELAEQIAATTKLDTVILTVTVTDPSPERAKTLADAVSAQFIAFVAELETPPGRDQATIKATVVDPPAEPLTPVSPQPLRNLGLGLALGLLLGAGIALLRETLDTTVKSPDDLKRALDLPVLGQIPFDKGAAKAPLIHGLDAYAPRVEGFRVLRTNLQFIDPDKSSKVFVITSALPEEGKSTSAINLAIVLAQGGERVCLLDGDLRRPMITSYLQLERNVGLTTLLVGRVDLDGALQETDLPGLEVLAAGRTPPNPAELLKSQATADILAELKARFDIVLVDAPPLLPVTDAALLADQADGTILVVRHGRTTVDDVRAAMERLHAVGRRAGRRHPQHDSVQRRWRLRLRLRLRAGRVADASCLEPAGEGPTQIDRSGGPEARSRIAVTAADCVLFPTECARKTDYRIPSMRDPASFCNTSFLHQFWVVDLLMTTRRALLAALLAATLSLFAAPAIAVDGYGPFGVFGSPNGGTFEEGDDIDVQFEATGLNCNSWTVTQDETGEAPSGGGGGSTFSFTVSPGEGTYSITARCNTSTGSQSAPLGGGSRGSLATYVQGAGENQDTITFTVGERGGDGDDGDGDGNGDGDNNGGLPDTGGSNVQLLTLGGTLAGIGAIIIVRARRRFTS